MAPQKWQTRKGAGRKVMTLPEAVRKQNEEADKKIQAIKDQQAKPAEPSTPAPSSAPSPAEPAKPPEQPPKVEPVSPDPTPHPEPAQGADAPWEQKYKTLAGKYAKEVPTLHAEIRNLREMIMQMKQAPAPAPQPDQPPQPYYTPEEKENFGELVDVNQQMLNRAGAHLKESISQSVSQQVGTEVQALQGQVQQMLHTQFLKELEGLIPDWRTVNEDPEWLIWLGEPDPLSGVPRQQLLDSAQQKNDASRAALFFRQFKQESKAPAPTQGKPVTTPSLAAQVVPAPGSRPNAPAGPRGKIYTAKDLHQISADISKRRYTPEEARKIMDEVNQAVLEGRVVTGDMKAPVAAAV